ncbi:hypothetical protein AX16_008946 [Volvariella volvacea WC 439]|nr:hypothetical protein AX16_008946 [Volvariella volvacea WC 439]
MISSKRSSPRVSFFEGATNFKMDGVVFNNIDGDLHVFHQTNHVQNITSNNKMYVNMKRVNNNVSKNHYHAVYVDAGARYGSYGYSRDAHNASPPNSSSSIDSAQRRRSYRTNAAAGSEASATAVAQTNSASSQKAPRRPPAAYATESYYSYATPQSRRQTSYHQDSYTTTMQSSTQYGSSYSGCDSTMVISNVAENAYPSSDDGDSDVSMDVDRD